MKTKTKPSFCYIAPTSYLDFVVASDTHLVLAHLVDTDDKYADFYLNESKNDTYIIMDNSAYELKEPFSPSELVRLGHRCGANAIVLPDYPFEPGSRTISAANNLLYDFKQDGFDVFFVPQSKMGDYDDWLYTYQWAANHPDIDIIGMSILGIPGSIPHITPTYARVVMSQRLLDSHAFVSEKHHHYLGLNAGPKLEIPSLLSMGVLDSIDSSGPIWSAILGHQYTDDSDSFQMTSKLKLPVDFSLPLTKDQCTIDRVKHNIVLTESLFYPSGNNSIWYAQE